MRLVLINWDLPIIWSGGPRGILRFRIRHRHTRFRIIRHPTVPAPNHRKVASAPTSTSLVTSKFSNLITRSKPATKKNCISRLSASRNTRSNRSTVTHVSKELRCASGVRMRSQRAKSKRLLVIVTSGILRQEDPARNPVGQSYIHDDLIGMGVVVFGSLYPSDAADAATGFRLGNGVG